MLEGKIHQTRVAVLATSEQHTNKLSSLLEEAGLIVVVHETPGKDFLNKLKDQRADVLLVDMSTEPDSQIEIIDTLLEQDSLPIFFNDSGPEGSNTNPLWAKKLARKLDDIARKHPAPALQEKPVAAELDQSDIIDETSVTDSASALNVWVLGASLGGPQAVRQFLSAVKQDLPVAFILAQHIGANHINLLAEQLDRISPFKVTTAKNGQIIRHHEVILAPADKQLHITTDGYIALSPAAPDAIYSPCINNVITTVAQQYGKKAGAIIFSGMGDDGALGCTDMAKSGGIVWAQDVDSCVISSMPDQARKTNTVTFSAEPQALADHLYQYYSEGAH